MDLLSLFQLLVFMKWFFFFSFISGTKKIYMLLIAIVSLQFILLQYSLCSICLDNLYVIYIYIYISAVVHGRLVLQKTQL